MEANIGGYPELVMPVQFLCCLLRASYLGGAGCGSLRPLKSKVHRRHAIGHLVGHLSAYMATAFIIMAYIVMAYIGMAARPRHPDSSAICRHVWVWPS